MHSILSRLQHYEHIKIVVFSDDTILKEPVDMWPVCDCLLAFFSKGFPLQKATEYVRLRKPFVFNDLSIQYTLQDRSKVYEILKQNEIQVPRYTVLKRPDDELNETKDTIEVNGEVFHKPFVEKPLSAEDHNVHIYFPSDYGGGCQRLFRKVSYIVYPLTYSITYCMTSTIYGNGKRSSGRSQDRVLQWNLFRHPWTEESVMRCPDFVDCIWNGKMCPVILFRAFLSNNGLHRISL
jgi:hypothetical protein